jgi:tetratricopeptide (TPR) repeat protein
MVSVVPLNLSVAAADRFLYLPVAGLAVGLAAVLAPLRGWRARAAVVLASAAVPAFSIATDARNADWADEVRLWRKAVAGTVAADLAPSVELGNALTNAGHLDEALAIFDRLAAQGEPYDSIGLENAAAVLADLGRIAEAHDRFALLVAREPAHPLHRFNLAATELRLLRFDDAERDLRKVLQIAARGHTIAPRGARRAAAGVARRAALGSDPAGGALDAAGRAGSRDAALDRRRASARRVAGPHHARRGIPRVAWASCRGRGRHRTPASVGCAGEHRLGHRGRCGAPRPRPGGDPAVKTRWPPPERDPTRRRGARQGAARATAAPGARR